MNVIKALDLSNLTVPFSIEQNTKFKSFTGGLIMLFFYIFAICYSLYSFIRFAKQVDFTVEVYTLTQDQDERLNLADSPFVLSYTLLDRNFGVSQELLSYLEFTVEQIKYSPTERVRVVPIPNVPCAEEDVALFGEDSEIVSYGIPYQKGLFCLDRTNIKIGGNLFKNDFDELFIRISIKDEKRNSTDMRALEEILEEPSARHTFVILFSVPISNPKENAPNYRMVHKVLNLSYLDTLTSTLHLNKTEFEHSTSILWNRTEIIQTIDFLDFETRYISRNNKFIAEINLTLAKESKKIVRKVKLFSQFLAETTVLIFNFYSILAFLLRKLNKLILIGEVAASCFFTRHKVGKKEDKQIIVFDQFDWWKCKKRDSALFKAGKGALEGYLDLFSFVKRMQMVDCLVERLGSREANRMRILSVDMLDEPKEKTVLKKIDWTVQECQDDTSRSCISALRNSRSRIT